ncbi:hypothetical protein W97_01057 [Coniosporium apollinis CBS 100218]|uniref:Uncharacterized protein n=1 Tax=Coniosporium apollinis (strain CBS 100218) TaxID=1168221 RepID=R7YJ56_CONA1|nr:uncharacterized protein W97_01057 [Coniosporium apollinis CBS 100218]EON61839.1 hypothetical protein W97_01057 [Coniosporium apollinis CBS 100218]
MDGSRLRAAERRADGQDNVRDTELVLAAGLVLRRPISLVNDGHQKRNDMERHQEGGQDEDGGQERPGPV